MSGILDKQSMMEKVYDEYFINREWWIFVTPFAANHRMAEMENKFFSGEKNKDFHLVTYLPFGGLYFAKKTEINRDEINKVLGVEEIESNPNGDVFNLDEGDPKRNMIFFYDFATELKTIHDIRNGK